MERDLATRRRLLLVTYRRYVAADRALALAVQEMRSWFPTASLPHRGTIGEPGSRLRRLYERRSRAILQLQVAREKLETARERQDARRSRAVEILLIPLQRG